MGLKASGFRNLRSMALEGHPRSVVVAEITLTKTGLFGSNPRSWSVMIYRDGSHYWRYLNDGEMVDRNLHVKRMYNAHQRAERLREVQDIVKNGTVVEEYAPPGAE